MGRKQELFGSFLYFLPQLPYPATSSPLQKESANEVAYPLIRLACPLISLNMYVALTAFTCCFLVSRGWGSRTV